MVLNIKKRTFSHNIINLTIIKVCKWFMLFMPIIVIFYQENGLDEQKIANLLAIYSIVIAISEIPSGYLSDVWGRKNTIILGVGFSFLGFVIYSVSSRFMSFVVAELFLGIGQSMVSGADSALLYDSLLEMKKENKFVKYEGRMVSVGNFSEAAAGILGGILADISIRYPFYVQTGVSFFAIPAAIFLIEPSRHEALEEYNIRQIIKIVKYSLIDNKLLRYAILLSSVVGVATLSMAWFAQLYFNFIHLKLSYIGIIWTVLNLTVGVFSFLSYKVENKIGEKRALWLIAVFIPLGYILLCNFATWWGILIIFLFYIIRGIATPILKNNINKFTKSNIRATVLSVRDLVIRVFFAIIFPFLGWYNKIFNLLSAILLAGIIFLFFNLIFLLFYFKYKE
ncbi:MAG: MFS transporter [Bacteroidales bacterium]|nr:MFS transporter [Bacteroidales bacterium]